MQNQYNDDDDNNNNNNQIFLTRAIMYILNSYINSNLITKRQAAIILEHLAQELIDI